MSAMTINECCEILQPLLDLASVERLNGPSGRRLAELISAQASSAEDLTVRDVLQLLTQVCAEANSSRVPAP